MENHNKDGRDPLESKSLGREIGEGLKSEVRSSLRWASWGAALGAAAFGGAGLWFLGADSLLVAVLVGAGVGGLGALWFYLSANNFI